MVSAVFGVGNAVASQPAGPGRGKVTVRVVTETGRPVPGAVVGVANTGETYMADDKGLCTLPARISDVLVVKTPQGNAEVNAGDAAGMDVVVRKDGFKGSGKVYLPMATVTDKRFVTGSARSYGEEDVNKYPTNDFRNSLTGVITGLDILEKTGSTGMFINSDTTKVMLRTRGLAPNYIVDDMPVFITQVQIDPEEIESVTLVRDIADKALFGPMAANGIVYITTKRGVPGSNRIRVNVEKGVSVVDRFPEWVSGAEYAELNNIARRNSEEPELYIGEDIAAFRLQDAYSMTHPSVDYRSLMLKDTKSYTKASVLFNGGTENVRYNAYVGYAGEGDIYKAGAISDYNRLNVRTSLDARITKSLDVNFGFFGGMTFRRSPMYGTDLEVHEFTKVMSDLTAIPATAFPLYMDIDPGDGDVEDDAVGRTIYGVSTKYGNNPYASLVENGFYTDKARTGVVNATLNYDISALLPGLKSKTFVGMNLYNKTRIGQNPDYVAYLWDRFSGATTISSHKGEKVSDNSLMQRNFYQSFNLYEKLSYDYASAGHKVGVTATYYMSSVERTGIESFERQQNVIATAAYSYLDKYIVQAVGTCAGSSMFAKGKRFGFFPSFGLAWVASEEDFLKNAGWLDFLKIRGQAGILGYEHFMVPYYHEDYYKTASGVTFGPYSGRQWFGSDTYKSKKTALTRLGNPDLTWEKRKELSVGFDMSMLGNRLYADFTYYRNVREGIITEMKNAIPIVYGLRNTQVYENYDSHLYEGCELTLSWSDRIGNFRYSIGGNATWQRTEYLKRDESFTYDYQSVIGTSLDSYRGYVYLGKFESDAQVASLPKQTFDEQLFKGDLIYADLNDDGVIDANDQRVIGNTAPKLFYSVNIFLQYGNFDLTVLGTGRAFYDVALTNKYFHNGWGDGNISAFVRDNVGGDYPRLTYDKVNNNFVDSGYWLRDGSFFKLQNVELGYNVPLKSANKVKVRGLRVFVRGANLFTISGIKDVDPEAVSAGVTDYPLFRTFTGGVKINF